MNPGSVNSNGEMCCIHAVFVCPQRGTGVLASSETRCNCRPVNYDSKVIVLAIVRITNFNSRLTGSTAVAVIEGAVVYDKIGDKKQ